MHATDPHERLLAIDVVRGLALFGVMAVNLVNEFRVSIFEQHLGTLVFATLRDVAAGTFVNVALQAKAISLFSFLFGVSLAILYERLSRSGRPLYWLSRRLTALLALGALHLLFIWNGDILTHYALAGFLVLPLLASSRVTIAFVAIVLLLVFAALPFPPPAFPWPSPEELREHVAQASDVYRNGGYWELLRFYLRELPLVITLAAYVFPRTVALILLGILAWRTGLFRGTRLDRRRLICIAAIGLSVGGFLTLAPAAGAELAIERFGLWSYSLPALAPVLLAFGYGGAAVSFAQRYPNSRPITWLAPIGRMAFTNYVLQSLVFSFVFFYGLGYFGRAGAFATLLFGVAVFALQCWASAWWLRHYRFGPLEWLWRTLMYGRVQPMRSAV